MTKRLLIDGRQAEETRVVLLSGTRIEDFDYETENRKQLKGNVYLARVTRVEPSLQAAFVEYGGNRQGFLAFSEIHPDYYRIPVEDREALIEADKANNDDEGLEANTDDEPETLGGEGADEDDILPKRQVKKYKIQEVISRKQIMLVQVAKEERGNKGAALTTYLSLAGRYCVLMPNNNRGGGVSRKITNLVDRKRLKTVVGGLDIQDGMAVIVRTAGAKRTKTEIIRDFNYLSKLWDDIRARTLESQAPCMIHEEGDLIKRSIRDLYTNEVDEVLVEGEEAYKIARNQMKMLIPSHLKKVKKYDDTQPIFQHFDAENQMDTIHSPHVTLKSGGYLVINQTEALVAIDVNSGKSTRERNIEETALKTNLEAAEELGRQLRLRDLSGLIVVDFIDMEENRNQHAVERRMKDAMRNDRARIQIGSISHFGLLEMSRQRLRLSINESISNLCPHCEGTGRIRSIDTAALQLLRSIEEEAQKGKMDGMHITAHRDVVLFVLNQKRSAIADIESRFGLTVVLSTDDSLIAPEYKIERVGWQGRSTSKQSSRQAQQRNQDKKNVVTDESDSEGEETSADASEFHSDEKEAGTENGNLKRRRRGRRGGRRRRRRNEEGGQADENLSPPVKASDPVASQSSNQESSETPDVIDGQQDDEAAQGKPGRGRKHRERPAKSGARKIDALVSDTANELVFDNPKPAGSNTSTSNISALDEAETARATNSKTALPKQPARKRKKTATGPKTSEKINDSDSSLTKADEDPNVDSPVVRAKKTTKKVARGHKSKVEVVAPDDKPAESKRAADKKTSQKPAKKATKKAASKSDKKAEAKTINVSGAAVSKTQTSREPISSDPQDVIKIGSDGPKSPRRGWWSRS